MNIVLNNVTVDYGNKKALDDVSLTFEEGKTYCVLGPNGCGKSTLIKEIIQRNQVEGELSYVAQESIGNIALTTYEYVALGRYDKRKFWGGLSADDKSLITSSMKKMGLEDLANNIYDTLSGGEKQRAMIARAIAQDANWVIMDEPTASLDARYVRLMIDTINELKAKGKSVIVVLHDLSVADTFADKYVLLKDGKLVDIVDELNQNLLASVYDTEFISVEADGKKRFILKC